MSQLLPLVNIEQKTIAVIFVDYLKSIGCNAKLQAAKDDHNNTGGWTVYCLEVDLPRCKSEFEDYINNPHQAKYQQSAWQNGGSVQLNSSGFGNQFKSNFLLQAGPFTLIIFALCWLVYVATFGYFGNDSFNLLKFNISGDLQQTLAEPWRLLTPALFHFSLLHIAFNTMWWWQLGGQIEKVLGLKHIVIIFLSAALLSNIAQFYMSGPNFGGLSGVVYAVVGFVWIFGHQNPGKGIFLSTSTVGFLLFWLVLGFTEFMPINVANTAHLVGLLVGMGYAVLLGKQRR